jgi:predicted DNA-binding protein YlxM (UPF0122 family)
MVEGILLKEKNLAISMLLDFYGEILTDKQKEVVDLYYNEDLSLAEIAEQAQITRQGVRDCIKRGETTLLLMEDKLRLVEKFGAMKKYMDEINDSAAMIDEINARYCFSSDIGLLAKKIKENVQELSE